MLSLTKRSFLPILIVSVLLILSAFSFVALKPSSAHAAGRIMTVSSTAYCDHSNPMANGNRVHDGAVAMNSLPLGTQIRVLSGSFAGRVFTVEDHIGWGSDCDFWVCSQAQALSYGRQTIQIEVLG